MIFFRQPENGSGAKVFACRNDAEQFGSVLAYRVRD